MSEDYESFDSVGHWFVNGHSVRLVRSPTTGKERVIIPKAATEDGSLAFMEQTDVEADVYHLKNVEVGKEAA